MRHSISKVASVLNISPALIRHYEKKGILSYNRAGSYRSFDTADFMVLQRCQIYRKFDISLDDISRLINDGSPQAVSAQMEQSISALERDILFRQMIIRSIQRQKSRIARISDLLDSCWEESIPAFWVQPAIDYRQPAKKLTNYWLSAEYAPFAEASLRIRNFGVDKIEKKDYVITIFDEFADILEITTNRAERVPQQRCLYSIIKSNPNVYLRPQQVAFMKDYAQEHQIEIQDTTYFRYLHIAKNKDDSGYECYLEVWMPMKQDD